MVIFGDYCWNFHIMLNVHTVETRVTRKWPGLFFWANESQQHRGMPLCFLSALAFIDTGQWMRLFCGRSEKKRRVWKVFSWTYEADWQRHWKMELLGCWNQQLQTDNWGVKGELRLTPLVSTGPEGWKGLFGCQISVRIWSSVAGWGDDLNLDTRKGRITFSVKAFSSPGTQMTLKWSEPVCVTEFACLNLLILYIWFFIFAMICLNMNELLMVWIQHPKSKVVVEKMETSCFHQRIRSSNCEMV